MSTVFIKIFNLGITAGWIVLAILLLRPLLKKAPRWINCLLWGIVGLRLVFPFSLESIFSLIPSAEPLPSDITMTPAPAINSGIGAINSAVNPIISETLTPEVGASANPMQIVVEVAAYLWVIGIALMLIYGIVSYIRLAVKVRVSVKQSDRIYFCDEVDSPFILGVLRPRIYLPSGMIGEEMEYVIAHEKAHLKRKDHLWKPIGYALLSVYWFNPLLWVAYVLLCRDIEMACDEKVIKKMEPSAKKGYSEALLSCSVHRKRIMACPLAFGEVGVKERIKSVLNYKKPAFWIIVIALVATVIISVCFLTNPMTRARDILLPGTEWVCEDDAIIAFYVDENEGMKGYLTFDSQTYDIVMYYRTAGFGVHVSVFKGQEYDTVLADSDLLLTGIFKVRSGELVLEVDRDNLGLEHDELFFEKSENSGLIGSDGTTVVSLEIGKNLYIYVSDYGTYIPNVSIEFKQVRLNGDDIVFTIDWKNNSNIAQPVGPQFEISRYEDDALVPLADNGAWNEYLELCMAGGGDTCSYNLTGRFDISEPGRYRFTVYDAWVDFQIVNTDYSDSAVYDTEIYDIDGDGKQEICEVSRGFTSGFFTFIFRVSEPGEEKYEIYDVFYSDWMDFEFVISDDGKLRLQGTTQQGEVRLYDIGVADGYVTLTKDGVPLLGFRADGTNNAGKTGKTDSTDVNRNINIESLKTLYPAYFGLDASKGLDVYVWQMAGGLYDFGLLPYSEERDWLDSELWSLRGASAEEMRAILSTYDISEDKIRIIPWQNPVSSYIGDYWGRWTAIEDATPYQNMYIAMLHDMIFGDTVRTKYPNVYEQEWFDVDGDGEDEFNKVCLGLVDGRFMFSYIISEDGKTAEYYDNFYTEPMGFKFFTSSDGKVRLRGRTESGEVRIFDISVKNGHVELTENGGALGYLETAHEDLDLSKADFSLVDRIIITDGMTGEKKYFRDILNRNNYNTMLGEIKKIKGSDPVSNRGYSGFRYYVELYYDTQLIYSFAIFNDEVEGARLICGYYETVGGFDYPCRYKLTSPSYENLEKAIGKYFK